MRRPAQAYARREGDGFMVAIGAADIGTGARTVLTQIAADALGVDPARVRLELGDSALPPGPVAGGSAGAAPLGSGGHRGSAAPAPWGSPAPGACRALEGCSEAHSDPAQDIENESELARHAFGAQFA